MRKLLFGIAAAAVLGALLGAVVTTALACADRGGRLVPGIGMFVCVKTV